LWAASTKRIQSMAKAHSLLTQSRWEGVSVDRLVREELQAYGLEPGVIMMNGVDAVLTPRSALSLSLALHELARPMRANSVRSLCPAEM